MRIPNSLLSPSTCSLALALVFGLSACGHLGVKLGGEDDNLKAGADASVGPDDGNTGGAGKDPLPPENTGGKPGIVKPPEPDSGLPIKPSKDAAAPEPGDAGHGTVADGGHPDDAGMMSVDSSVEPPKPEPVDSGPPPRDPHKCDDRGCDCAPGEQCLLTCLNSPCKARCDVGSHCFVAVGESTDVLIECAEGATCTTKDLNVDSVNFSCRGKGDCVAGCGLADECNIDCTGNTGSCSLDCQEADACFLTCGDLSRCVLKNPPTNGGTEACKERKECLGNVVVCNGQCPVDNLPSLPAAN